MDDIDELFQMMAEFQRHMTVIADDLAAAELYLKKVHDAVKASSSLDADQKAQLAQEFYQALGRIVSTKMSFREGATVKP